MTGIIYVALWQSKLNVSYLALRLLFGWQSFLCGFLLYHLLKGDGTYINLFLGGLVILECRIAAKALRAQVGDIEIDERHNWIWRNQRWQLQGQPCLFNWGALIKLTRHQRRICFWLMQDKMSESEWRQLRRYLLWHYPKYRKGLIDANGHRNVK